MSNIEGIEDCLERLTMAGDVDGLMQFLDSFPDEEHGSEQKPGNKSAKSSSASKPEMDMMKEEETLSERHNIKFNTSSQLEEDYSLIDGLDVDEKTKNEDNSPQHSDREIEQAKSENELQNSRRDNDDVVDDDDDTKSEKPYTMRESMKDIHDRQTKQDKLRNENYEDFLIYDEAKVEVDCDKTTDDLDNRHIEELMQKHTLDTSEGVQKYAEGETAEGCDTKAVQEDAHDIYAQVVSDAALDESIDMLSVEQKIDTHMEESLKKHIPAIYAQIVSDEGSDESTDKLNVDQKVEDYLQKHTPNTSENMPKNADGQTAEGYDTEAVQADMHDMYPQVVSDAALDESTNGLNANQKIDTHLEESLRKHDMHAQIVPDEGMDESTDVLSVDQKVEEYLQKHTPDTSENVPKNAERQTAEGYDTEAVQDDMHAQMALDALMDESMDTLCPTNEYSTEDTLIRQEFVIVNHSDSSVEARATIEGLQQENEKLKGLLREAHKQQEINEETTADLKEQLAIQRNKISDNREKYAELLSDYHQLKEERAAQQSSQEPSPYHSLTRGGGGMLAGSQSSSGHFADDQPPSELFASSQFASSQLSSISQTMTTSQLVASSQSSSDQSNVSQSMVTSNTEFLVSEMAKQKKLITRLKAKIIAQEVDKKELQRKVDDKRDTIQKIVNNFGKEKAAHQKLTTDYQALTQTVQSLEAEVQKQRTRIEQLAKQEAAAAKETDEQPEVEKLRKELKEKDEDINQRAAQIAYLTEENKVIPVLEQTMQAYEEDFNAERRSREELNDKLLKVQAELERLQDPEGKGRAIQAPEPIQVEEDERYRVQQAYRHQPRVRSPRKAGLEYALRDAQLPDASNSEKDAQQPFRGFYAGGPLQHRNGATLKPEGRAVTRRVDTTAMMSPKKQGKLAATKERSDSGADGGNAVLPYQRVSHVRREPRQDLWKDGREDDSWS